MHKSNVYPTISNIVNQWLDQIAYSLNSTFPLVALRERSRTEEAVPNCYSDVGNNAEISNTAFDDSITLQIDTKELTTEPIIMLTGMLNESNYQALIEQALEVYTLGYRQITLDLDRCTNVKLSGLFALLSIHALFHGERPPDPQDGFNSIRQMITKIRSNEIAENVLFKNAKGNVAEILMKNGLLSIH